MNPSSRPLKSFGGHLCANGGALNVNAGVVPLFCFNFSARRVFTLKSRTIGKALSRVCCFVGFY